MIFLKLQISKESESKKKLNENAVEENENKKVKSFYNRRNKRN